MWYLYLKSTIKKMVKKEKLYCGTQSNAVPPSTVEVLVSYEENNVKVVDG